jgi:hypothetical protein
LRDCQRHSDEVACAVGDPALATLRREGAIDDAETLTLGARERARRDASEEGREQEHADDVLRRDGDGVSRRRRMELGCEERSAQGLEPVTERSMDALAALRSHEPLSASHEKRVVGLVAQATHRARGLTKRVTPSTTGITPPLAKPTQATCRQRT